MTKCEFYYECCEALESCRMYDWEPEYKKKVKCRSKHKSWKKAIWHETKEKSE